MPVHKKGSKMQNVVGVAINIYIFFPASVSLRLLTASLEDIANQGRSRTPPVAPTQPNGHTVNSCDTLRLWAPPGEVSCCLEAMALPLQYCHVLRRPRRFDIFLIGAGLLNRPIDYPEFVQSPPVFCCRLLNHRRLCSGNPAGGSHLLMKSSSTSRKKSSGTSALALTLIF